MHSRFLINDVLRGKAIHFVLFLFISLSCFVFVSSTQMVLTLSSSLTYLFQQSKLPDFSQMHEGDINSSKIEDWAKQNTLLKKLQIVNMVKVDASNIHFINSQAFEKHSIMNLYFVSQNTQFDFLPNTHGAIINPNKGEVAIPIYFLDQYHLKKGDTLEISTPWFHKKFIIVDYIRDAQMNPAFVHSKRLLINPDDWKMLATALGARVHFIEFQLKDQKDLRTFSNAYQGSNLPQNGPTLSYSLFKSLNSLSDGIIIAVMVLVCILLLSIALLCIRFTLLATIEEDFQQIGILKAIGIRFPQIRKIYMIKYYSLAALGCTVGYFGATLTKSLFIKNISLYLGVPPSILLQDLVPILSTFFIFLLTSSFCFIIFRKAKKITIIQALKFNPTNSSHFISLVPIYKKRFMFNINITLGLKDVFQQLRVFLLLFIVLIFSSFIVIFPFNYYNTIKSENFITYLGIGRADVRIDLSKIDANQSLESRITNYIKNDPDVKKFAVMTTGRFRAINQNQTLDNLNIETGDFLAFPLKYLEGHAPSKSDEIALSYLSSKQFKKAVGSSISVEVNKNYEGLRISGIYQDITNGGQTAKAILPIHPNQTLWKVINISFKPDININSKISEYEKIFSPIKIISIHDYLSQTLGNLIDRVKMLSILSIIISIAISILITILFLKLLIAKQIAQIAILRILGFSRKNILLQYFTRIIFILLLSIITGSIIANIFGGWLINTFWSYLGASQIQFVIKALMVYCVLPGALILTVSLATVFTLLKIKNVTIGEISHN